MRSKAIVSDVGLNVFTSLLCFVVIVCAWLYLKHSFLSSLPHDSPTVVLDGHFFSLTSFFILEVICSLCFGSLVVSMQTNFQKSTSLISPYLCSFMVSLAIFSYLFRHGIFLIDGMVHCFFVYLSFIFQAHLLRSTNFLNKVFTLAHHTLIAGVGFLLFPQMIFFLFVTWCYTALYVKQRFCWLCSVIQTAFFFVPLYLCEVYNYAVGSGTQIEKIKERVLDMFAAQGVHLFSSYVVFKLFMVVVVLSILFCTRHALLRSKSMKYIPILFLLAYLFFVVLTSESDQHYLFYSTILGVVIFFMWATSMKYYRLLVTLCFSFSLYLLF